MVRPSYKRQRLFNTYALLRCAMDSDDIAELLRRNPKFQDRTMEDTDYSIQAAIDDITATMVTVQPPDLTNATPLRG